MSNFNVLELESDGHHDGVISRIEKMNKSYRGIRSGLDMLEFPPHWGVGIERIEGCGNLAIFVVDSRRVTDGFWFSLRTSESEHGLDGILGWLAEYIPATASWGVRFLDSKPLFTKRAIIE